MVVEGCEFTSLPIGSLSYDSEVLERSVFIGWRVEFVPKAVQYAEADGKAEAKNPGEIPHFSLRLVKVGVGTYFGQGDAAKENLQDPCGVGENERQKDQRHNQHNP